MNSNIGVGVFGDFGNGFEFSDNIKDINYALSKSTTTGSQIYTNDIEGFKNLIAEEMPAHTHYWGEITGIPVVQNDYITSEVLNYVTKINEEGDNNMEILTIYKNRKMTKLLKYYEEFKNTAELYLEENKEEFDGKALGCLGLTTKKIDEKIKELDIQYNEDRKAVERLIEEVSARLELAENGAEKTKILEIYNILDENGKINA